MKTNNKQKIIFIFKIILVVFISLYLYKNYENELINFKFLNYNLYILCILFILGSIFTHSFRWYYILKKKIHIKLSDLIIVIFKSLFISTFTPSVIGFDAYRLYFLKKKKLSNRFSVFSILVDRLSGLLIMFLFLIFFLNELFFYYLNNKLKVILIFIFFFSNFSFLFIFNKKVFF